VGQLAPPLHGESSSAAVLDLLDDRDGFDLYQQPGV
jgi:hypothetical protein